jgi:hypothetical protein
MPFDATIIDDEEHPWRYRESAQGLEVDGWYRVNTGVWHRALYESAGLPKIGDLYDPSIPLLQVVSRAPEPWSRVDNGDGSGGWTFVAVQWRQPSGGSAMPAGENDAWTQLEFSAESVQVTKPVERVEGAQFTSPIANGDGFSARQGTLEATVTVFKPLTYRLPLERVVSLMRPFAKVNDADLVLPRLWSTQGPLNVRKGQALFLGMDPVERVGQLLRLRYKLGLAEDWYVRWSPVDAKGDPLGDVGPIGGLVVDRVYEGASFVGLW